MKTSAAGVDGGGHHQTEKAPAVRYGSLEGTREKKFL